MTIQSDLATISKYCEHAPVDVLAIAHKLELNPVAELMPANISGLIRRTDWGGFQIAYNSAHSLVRQRFTVAHEIGHYIFHRDLLGRGVGDTLAYRDDDSTLPNEFITLKEERQANTFAANLLMPNHLIERLRSEGISRPAQLAAKLIVSEAAMRIKLGLPAQRDLFGD